MPEGAVKGGLPTPEQEKQAILALMGLAVLAGKPASQPQFDAMVSLCYNIGPGKDGVTINDTIHIGDHND